MTWLIFLLLGIVIGLVVGVLIDRDTVYKGMVRIKQKGRQNTQDNTVKPETELKPKRTRRINKRLDKLNNKL